jgi:cytochrome c556
MFTMKKLLIVVATLVATTFSAASYAQFAKPDDAAKYRQGALTVMAAHFGRVGAMANGKVPYDAKVAKENIDIAVAMSKLPWAGFGSSGEGATIKNTAKPEIWTDQAKFKEHTETMQAALVNLQSAITPPAAAPAKAKKGAKAPTPATAKAGDLDAIKAAFGKAGASCKACHDAFRTQ